MSSINRGGGKVETEVEEGMEASSHSIAPNPSPHAVCPFLCFIYINNQFFKISPSRWSSSLIELMKAKCNLREND